MDSPCKPVVLLITLRGRSDRLWGVTNSSILSEKLESVGSFPEVSVAKRE
jgi:hypothetical protein